MHTITMQNNIVREEQKYALMRELVQKHRLEYEDETEFVSSILGEISMVKKYRSLHRTLLFHELC